MKQYNLSPNTLTLKVKKSPLFIRAITFFLAFLCFIIPILGFIFSLGEGNDFSLQVFVSFIIFGLLGFHLLRISLWNTYGEEIFEFSSQKVVYEVNYGWFKDSKKSLEAEEFIYSINRMGFEEDKKGVLNIKSENGEFNSVTKMPIDQLSELIFALQKQVPSNHD